MHLRRQFLLGAAALAGCGKPKAGRIAALAFVANAGDRSLAVIDMMRFHMFRKIALDASPAEVIALPGSGRVFALTPENGTVVEIVTDPLAPGRKLRVGGRAIAMRMAPDARSLWVLHADPPALVRVSLDSWHAVSRVKLPGAPRDFDLNANAAVVSLPGMHAIAILNLAAERIEHIVDIGAEPWVIRFRWRDGKQILTGNRNARTITIVDARTGSVVVNLPLALQPERFCFKDDGGQLFVSGRGRDAVAIVSPYQTEVAETVLAGRAPGEMAVSHQPEYLFVSNPESGDMTVIDIESRRVLAQVPVGQDPGEILITSDSQYALVLNRQSGDVAVIRISTIGNRRSKTAPLFTLIPVGSKPVSAAIYAL